MEKWKNQHPVGAGFKMTEAHPQSSLPLDARGLRGFQKHSGAFGEEKSTTGIKNNNNIAAY